MKVLERVKFPKSRGPTLFLEVCKAQIKATIDLRAVFQEPSVGG